MEEKNLSNKLLLLLPTVISIGGLFLINRSIKMSAYISPIDLVTNSFLLLILVALSVIIMQLELIKDQETNK